MKVRKAEPDAPAPPLLHQCVQCAKHVPASTSCKQVQHSGAMHDQLT
jgi:hypothetical protein